MLIIIIIIIRALDPCILHLLHQLQVSSVKKKSNFTKVFWKWSKCTTYRCIHVCASHRGFVRFSEGHTHLGRKNWSCCSKWVSCLQWVLLQRCCQNMTHNLHKMPINIITQASPRQCFHWFYIMLDQPVFNESWWESIYSCSQYNVCFGGGKSHGWITWSD